MSESNETIAGLVHELEKSKSSFQRTVPLTQNLTKLAEKIQKKQKNTMELKKIENGNIDGSNNSQAHMDKLYDISHRVSHWMDGVQNDYRPS